MDAQKEPPGKHTHREKAMRGPVRWIFARQEDTSGETNHVYNLVLDFWSPELWRNTFLMLKAPLLWYFVRTALQSNTDGDVYILLAETNKHTNKQTNGKRQSFLIMQLIKFDNNHRTQVFFRGHGLVSCYWFLIWKPFLRREEVW